MVPVLLHHRLLLGLLLVCSDFGAWAFDPAPRNFLGVGWSSATQAGSQMERALSPAPVIASFSCDLSHSARAPSTSDPSLPTAKCYPSLEHRSAQKLLGGRQPPSFASMERRPRVERQPDGATPNGYGHRPQHQNSHQGKAPVDVALGRLAALSRGHYRALGSLEHGEEGIQIGNDGLALKDTSGWLDDVSDVIGVIDDAVGSIDDVVGSVGDNNGAVGDNIGDLIDNVDSTIDLISGERERTQEDKGGIAGLFQRSVDWFLELSVWEKIFFVLLVVVGVVLLSMCFIFLCCAGTTCSICTCCCNILTCRCLR